MRLCSALFAFALLLSGSSASAVSPFFVFFDSNSARISSQAAAILDNAAASFSAADVRGFRLYGHADRIGSARYNLRLARRRAEAVRTYLARRGVPVAVMEVISMGEDRPLVETDAAEPQNRYVSVVITCINNPGPGFEYMRCRE